MNKMKISVEDEGKVIFQTGVEKDITPKTTKEVDTLIRKFNHNITFLKGVKSGIESTQEFYSKVGSMPGRNGGNSISSVSIGSTDSMRSDKIVSGNDSVIMNMSIGDDKIVSGNDSTNIGRPAVSGYNIIECPGVSKTLEAKKFDGGLYKGEFYLLDEFMKDKAYSAGTIKMISDSDIYYGEQLIVKEGCEIPYYNTIQSWGTDLYVDGYARVVLDLRAKGVSGSDFQTELLNNGKVALKNDFKFKVTPMYDVKM